MAGGIDTVCLNLIFVNSIKSYECYLFDLDGTLIDTVELICRCFFYSLGKFGRTQISQKDILANIGLPLKEQFKIYFPERCEEFINEITKIHMDYQLSIYKKHVKLFPSVKESLFRLKAKQKKLGIVTSRRMQTIELYLRHVEIYDLFETFITPDNTEFHKPRPEPVIKAMQILNSLAENTLFVGDSRFDIEAGSAAGVDTAFVSWSRNNPESLKTPPTYILSNLLQLCP